MAGYNFYWTGKANDGGLWATPGNWDYSIPPSPLKTSASGLGSTYVYTPGGSSGRTEDVAYIDITANINFSNSSVSNLRHLNIATLATSEITVIITLTTAVFQITGNLTIGSRASNNTTIRQTQNWTVYSSSPGFQFQRSYTDSVQSATVSVGNPFIEFQTNFALVCLGYGSATFSPSLTLLSDIKLNYNYYLVCQSGILRLNGYGFTAGRLNAPDGTRFSYISRPGVNYTRRYDFTTNQYKLSYIKLTGVDNHNIVTYSATYANSSIAWGKVMSVGSTSNPSSTNKFDITSVAQGPIVLLDCDPALKLLVNNGTNTGAKRSIQSMWISNNDSSLNTNNGVDARSTPLYIPPSDPAQAAMFDLYIIDGLSGSTACTILWPVGWFETIDCTGLHPVTHLPFGPGCPHPLALENSGDPYNYRQILVSGHFILNAGQTIRLGGYYYYSNQNSLYANGSTAGNGETIDYRGPQIYMMYRSTATASNYYSNHPMLTTRNSTGWIVDLQNNSLINWVSNWGAKTMYDSPSAQSFYNAKMVFTSLVPNIESYVVSSIYATEIGVDFYDNTCRLFIGSNCVLGYIWSFQQLCGVTSTIQGGRILSVASSNSGGAVYGFTPANYAIPTANITSYGPGATANSYYYDTISFIHAGGVLDLYSYQDIMVEGYVMSKAATDGAFTGTIGADQDEEWYAGMFIVNNNTNLGASAVGNHMLGHWKTRTTVNNTPTIKFNFNSNVYYARTGIIITDRFYQISPLDVYVYSDTGNLVTGSDRYNGSGNYCIEIRSTGNAYYASTSAATIKSRATTPPITRDTYSGTMNGAYSFAAIWKETFGKSITIKSTGALTGYTSSGTVTTNDLYVLTYTSPYDVLVTPEDYQSWYWGYNRTILPAGPLTVFINPLNGTGYDLSIIYAYSGSAYFIFNFYYNAPCLIDNYATPWVAGLDLSSNFSGTLVGWNSVSSTSITNYDRTRTFRIGHIEGGHLFNYSTLLTDLTPTLEFYNGGQPNLPALITISTDYTPNININGNYYSLSDDTYYPRTTSGSLSLYRGVIDQTLNTANYTPQFTTVNLDASTTYPRRFIHGVSNYYGNDPIFRVSGVNDTVWSSQGANLSITTLTTLPNGTIIEQFAPGTVSFTGAYGDITIYPGTIDNFVPLLTTPYTSSTYKTAYGDILPVYTYAPDQFVMAFDLTSFTHKTTNVVTFGDYSLTTASYVNAIFASNYTGVLRFNQDIVFCGSDYNPYNVVLNAGTLGLEADLAVLDSQAGIYRNSTATLYFQGTGVIRANIPYVSQSNLRNPPIFTVGSSDYQYALQSNQPNLPFNSPVPNLNFKLGSLDYSSDTSHYNISGQFRTLNLVGGRIVLNTYAVLSAVNLVIRDTIGSITKGGFTYVEAAASDFNIGDPGSSGVGSLITYNSTATDQRIFTDLVDYSNLKFANGLTFNANLGLYTDFKIGGYKLSKSGARPVVTINPCVNPDGTGGVTTATFHDLVESGFGPATFKFAFNSTSTFQQFTYTDTTAPIAANGYQTFPNTLSNTILQSTVDGAPWYISVEIPHQGTIKTAREVSNLSIKDSTALVDYMWFAPGALNRGTKTGIEYVPGSVGPYSYTSGTNVAYYNYDLGNNTGWVFGPRPSASMDEFFWPAPPYNWPSATNQSFFTQSWSSTNYTTSGSYVWIAPSNVYSVSVTAIGGGGGGGRGGTVATGGAGGSLAWKAHIPVTPNQSYLVVVGAGGAANSDGGSSYFIDVNTVFAPGGGRGNASNNTGTILLGGQPLGNIVGDGGGLGGSGGDYDGSNISGKRDSGGGGAGGYTGSGGRGSGPNSPAEDGQGGGGGGGTAGFGGGGGTGIFGQGISGTAGTGFTGGGGGSGGSTAIVIAGALYGGGGSTVALFTTAGSGGSGAVRISWPGFAGPK